jgi:hypothetical protein
MLVFEAFSAVLPALHAGLTVELPKVRRALQKFKNASAKPTESDDDARALGEALFEYSRAWDRVHRLQSLFDAEKTEVLKLHPTLANSEAKKAAELAGRRGLPVPEKA